MLDEQNAVLNDTSGLPEPERESDLWFNPFRFPGSERACSVVHEVVHEIENHGARKRARRLKDQQSLRATMTSVVTNLIYHHLSGRPGEGVPVPRAKNDLGGKATRYQPFVFPRSFPDMLDTLCDLEFAKQAKGEFSGLPAKSKRTTVTAGPKLVELINQHQITFADFEIGDDEEIIILKGQKRERKDVAKREPYDDNATTRRYREELREINARLQSADITFDPGVYEHAVDVRARRLYRHFSNGNFESGGRLFGGFWQNIPKDVRLRGIRIEGERVEGRDYSQLNPRLAYSVAGAVPPSGDAYTLPNLEQYREGVKEVFNAMLFHHPVVRFPVGTRALIPDKKVKITDVTEGILEQHPMLKGVLSSGWIGHRLQFLESEIMMAVLRKCRDRSIVALPVFDCVVARASAMEIVERIMQSSSREIAGLDISIKPEVA